MGRAVLGVPVRYLDVDRHGAVATDGKDPEQVLEVRAVILVMAEGHDEGRLSPHERAGCPIVGAVQGEARRVVVELRERDLELLDHVDHEIGQQGAAVGVEQPIQRPPDPIVVQESGLVGLEPEQGGHPGLSPFA